MGMPLTQNPQMQQGSYPQGNMLSSMMSTNNGYPMQYADPNQNIDPYTANYANPNQNIDPNAANYAKGGEVKRNKKSKQNNPYPALAEIIRQQGKGEDTILAHISPLEAMMLYEAGGSGTRNPKTGVPQFGFFSNPFKATKSFFTKPKRALAETVALASAIWGGPIGGAAGGAAKEAILGRPKNMLSGALQGAFHGAAIPGVANLAGQGLSRLGANAIGSSLQNYSAANLGSWMGNVAKVGGGISGLTSSLGNMIGGSSAPSPSNYTSSNPISQNPFQNAATSKFSIGDVTQNIPKQEMGFGEKLLGNTKDFLTDPKNLLTMASVGSSFLNRPKPPKEKQEKSPEQIANEQKRLQKALRLNPMELKELEANLLAEEQMKRRIARQKFLPEERLGHIEPLHRKTHTPEEYKKHGKWMSYYNNPEFTGEPIPFKKGGLLETIMMEQMHPESGYIDGIGGGQDDDIRMDLPENSYIIDASTVSDIGDGNSRAGTRKIEALVSSGEHKITPDKLDLLVKNVRKHKRGGQTKLPPKAKPLAQYMRG